MANFDTSVRIKLGKMIIQSSPYFPSLVASGLLQFWKYHHDFVIFDIHREPNQRQGGDFSQKMTIWVNKVNRMICVWAKMWRMEKVPGHGYVRQTARPAGPSIEYSTAYPLPVPPVPY